MVESIHGYLYMLAWLSTSCTLDKISKSSELEKNHKFKVYLDLGSIYIKINGL